MIASFRLVLLMTLAALGLLLVGCRTRREAVPEVDASVLEASIGNASAAEAGIEPTEATDAGTRARPVWVPKLPSEAEFLAYSKTVGGERFTKFVVDTKSQAVYYVDADLYPMHKDFVFAELLKVPRTPEAERAFDKNYGKEKPNFIMCYLVHHTGPDLWTLAFWDGDKATAAHVRLAYARMTDTFYLGQKVKFRPASDEQESVAKEVAEIPSITNDQIYKAVGYQPFHKGSAVGTLRIVPAGTEASALELAPDEIVILPEPLSDITPVAGIVSQTFSTPLAHVNLRAAAWGIPNIGLRDAAKTYAALDGKKVYFEATETTATIRLATAKEAASALASRTRVASVQVPNANLAERALRPLSGLRAKDASAYGSKASNLGEIVFGRLPGVSVPPGFGVPIAYYAAHLEASGIDKRIETMLADPKFRGSLAERKSTLAKVRAQIVAAKLDPAFVSQLTTSLRALVPPESDAGTNVLPPGVFVRSSTNAEDLPGFSGAGLYDTVPNVRGEAAVGEAVKRVWASVWNLAAYEEREFYRIDHRRVYGAVLVQVGVDATAAGVLVTAHPTNAEDRNTFTVNAKSGLGIRVVDGKKVPEILLFNVHNRGLRVVSRSDEETMLVFDADGGIHERPNPQKGQPVLTSARVAKLCDAAEKIRGIFPRDRPLDIEWVLRGDDVFIVQSRPYMGGPATKSAAPRPTP